MTIFFPIFHLLENRGKLRDKKTMSADGEKKLFKSFLSSPRSGSSAEMEESGALQRSPKEEMDGTKRSPLSSRIHGNRSTSRPLCLP